MHDYIVIGSGIAGLFTALQASKHGTVLVLTKAALEESNTRYAQGGIAAAVAPEDSPRLHFEDTIAAGAGLCDESAVEILTREAPERIRDLLALQVPFDRQGDELALGLEAAHRARRVLHAGGDATGFHIERTLCNALRAAGADVIEGCFVTEIVVENGRAIGVRAFTGAAPGADGTQVMRARHIVLASGGAGQLFSNTTNPSVATGDGLALAYRAGAELADIEFYQFHPTALSVPGVPSFLISEAVRGEGAYLRNQSGERFMQRVDPRAELAPRDVVARAISAEMRSSGSRNVFIDLTHLPSEMVKKRFPTIDAYCSKIGLDMTTDQLPVAPAAHYLMGGVRTNLWGETSVPGLYACGEVACSGVHGANRLASNSLLEGLVFGARIVSRTLNGDRVEPNRPALKTVRLFESDRPARTQIVSDAPSMPALQELMWNRVGLVRDEAGLTVARTQFASWQQSASEPTSSSEYELQNMLLIGRLMTIAALERCESRGSHCRSDFPFTDPKWNRHIAVSKRKAARSAKESR